MLSEWDTLVRETFVCCSYSVREDPHPIEKKYIENLIIEKKNFKLQKKNLLLFVLYIVSELKKKVIVHFEVANCFIIENYIYIYFMLSNIIINLNSAKIDQKYF